MFSSDPILLQHYDRSNPVAVRCSLLLVVMTMVAGFFTSFYYFHRWKLCTYASQQIVNLCCLLWFSFIVAREMFNKVFKSWKFFSLRCLHPVRLSLTILCNRDVCMYTLYLPTQARFWKLFIAFVINITM